MCPSHFFYVEPLITDRTIKPNRRCDENITKGALKIGVVTEGSWGPCTQWHHLQCAVFKVANAEEVEGFADLDDALQASTVVSAEGGSVLFCYTYIYVSRKRLARDAPPPLLVMTPLVRPQHRERPVPSLRRFLRTGAAVELCDVLL